LIGADVQTVYQNSDTRKVSERLFSGCYHFRSDARPVVRGLTSADLKDPSIYGFQALAGAMRTLQARPPTLFERYRALTRDPRCPGAYPAAQARVIASVSAILGAGHHGGVPPRG